VAVRLKYKKIQNQYGMGLVEVIAALGLSILVLTSLVSLSLFTVRSSLQSKLLLEGTKLANRQLELVRAFRDSSDEWENSPSPNNGFLNQVMPCITGSPCHMNSGALSVDGSSHLIDAGTPKEIEVYFVAYDPDDGTTLDALDEEVRIAVTVRWTVAGDDKFARLYTDLTNWANK